MAQVENLTVHIGDLVMDAAMHDRVPPRWGNRSPDFAPQGVYRCAGDDQWLALSVRDDARVGGAAGRARRSRRRWPTRRSPRRPAGAPPTTRSTRVISAWTAARTKHDAFHGLQAAGRARRSGHGRGRRLGDPQLHERGFFHSLDHQSAGTHFHPGANFRLGGTPTVFWRAAPVLGQDNQYVYRELLGVSDEEYDALVAAATSATPTTDVRRPI